MLAPTMGRLGRYKGREGKSGRFLPCYVYRKIVQNDESNFVLFRLIYIYRYDKICSIYSCTQNGEGVYFSREWELSAEHEIPPFQIRILLGNSRFFRW